MPAITCDHMPEGGGLCPECQAEFEADPFDYMEWGPHPEGDRNTAALHAEMAEFYAANPQLTSPVDDSDIPF